MVIVLGAANGRAQTTPSTPPTKIWAPVDESNDWFGFDGENWKPVGVPAPADDVGIGTGEPALIIGDESPAAVAHTVTLGVVNGAVYSPGELDVTGGELTITPTGTANPGLQVLSESTLQIQGGFVELGNSTVDNFGQINIGTEGDGGTLSAGKVNNEKTGTIEGGLTFRAATGGTVVNAGNISGLIFSGVTSGIVVVSGPGNITNSGTISGLDGVDLQNGGSVNNGAGGKITGIGDGILSTLPFSGATEGPDVAPLAAASTVTIVNSGSISGAVGVEAEAGGTVTNNAGGVIQGTDGPGVTAALPDSGVVAPEPLTVVNSGTISGTAAGIDLEGGGSITNNAGGVIASEPGKPAVLSGGGPVAFSNAGQVNGSVTLANFANQATLVTGGTIAGA